MKPSKYSRHAAMICLSVRAAADSCIRHYVLQETALFEVGYRYKDADRNPLLRVCFCPSPLLSNLPADSLWEILGLSRQCNGALYLLQGYVKAPMSPQNGIGALSLGVIVDHTFEI